MNYKAFLYFLFQGQPYHEPVSNREVLVNNLPHITEREIADDEECDPSTHPTAQPTFMERSRSEMKCMSLTMIHLF